MRDRPETGSLRVTLNRPKSYNSLSTGLMAALQAELDTIRADRSVKAVIIGAAGPGFCAGHDLKEIRASPGRQQYEALFRQCSMLMQRSEEHTSELQSLMRISYAVFCLKKKKHTQQTTDKQ